MFAAADASTQLIAGPAQVRRPFSVFDLIGVARRHVVLIAICVAVSLAATAVYVKRQHPVYRATVEVLVDPQGLQVVGKDILPSDTSASLDFASVDSQPLIIASSSVLSDVIRKLDLEQDPTFTAGLPAIPSDLSPNDQKRLELMRFAHVIDGLRASTVVHRADPSLVFQITVSNPDPVRAAEIANTISTVYLRQSREARLDAVRRANEQLTSQATDLRSQFEQASRAVDQFKSASGLISTGQAGLVINQQLQDLTAQISQAGAELSRIAARRDQLRNFDHTAAETGGLPEAVTSQTIGALRAQYARLAETQAQLQGTLGPNHPTLQQNASEREAINHQIDDELDRIKASINADYERASANLADLKSRETELTKKQVVSGTSEIRARELQSDADAIQQVYNSVLNRTKELDLQQQIQTDNSRIISEAIPPVKASLPPKPILFAAGALFGLALGILIAYALEMFAADPLRDFRALTREMDTELLGLLPAAGARKRAPRKGDLALRGSSPADRAILMPTAEALSEHLGRWLPATVLVISAGKAEAGTRVARTLADALEEVGQETVLCTALDISTFIGNPGGGESEGETLPARIDPFNGREFILIDGATVDRKRSLAEIYPYADAVVVVSGVGRRAAKGLRAVDASLGRLASRSIGVVGVVGA